MKEQDTMQMKEQDAMQMKEQDAMQMKEQDAMQMKEQDAIIRIMAAAAANGNGGNSGHHSLSRNTLSARPMPVDVTLKLGLDFAVAGAQGSQQRATFRHALVQDIANATRLAPANFAIKHMSPGSLIVDIQIRPDSCNTFDPEGVARHLQSQADDPQSPLRSGTITRFTESVSLRLYSPPRLRCSQRASLKNLRCPWCHNGWKQDMVMYRRPRS